MQKRKKSFDVCISPVAHSVQRLYERSAPLLVVEALILACVGVIMLWGPIKLLTVMTFVLGCALILFGLYQTVVGFVASRGYYGGGWLDVLFGLINVGIGVLFCVYPFGSIMGLVYVFIILFLFKALRVLIFAINMVRARFGHWVFNLILSLILVAVAVFLLFYPMVGVVAVMLYLSAILLMYAFVDVYMFLQLRRLKNEVLE